MASTPRGPRSKSGGSTPRRDLLVGDRYLLQIRIGRGGHGEVWEAEDRLGGGLVAVKLLRAGRTAAPARLGSEVSILRLHQIPGVVRLLDESLGGALPFLVMERIHGAPFPGPGRRRSWARLSETTVALVETLARLHAEGVVHQDLKPANVLVDAAGKPTILDFGIASDRRLEELSESGDILGTVPYMAPERFVGDAVTPRADLYSLGVLLFEALTGRLPHLAKPGHDLIMACAYEAAPPVRQIAPRVPPAVAGLVDLLLARDPARRPRSALEVLGMLGGHPRPEPVEPALFRLGTAEPLDRLLAGLRGGRSVDLVGPRRTGRSRCLEEARAALEREGRRVVVLRPSPRAFASVRPIVGAMPEQASARLAEIAEVVVERLHGALAEGLVVLADDVDRMDAYSGAALARCRGAGALALVFEEPPAPRGAAEAETVTLAPLDEAALQRLFAGPERLFHLPSDAARILRARTDGIPARVVDELHEWLRAGVVASNGRGLVVARDLLDQLDARVAPGALGAVARGPDVPLPHGLEDLLAWLSLAWPDGTPELLGACLGQPVWEIEAQLEELVTRGAARRLADGNLEPLAAPSGDRGWSAERRRAEHGALAQAMPAGAPRRFFHLVTALGAAPEAAEIVALADEAIALAGRLADAREGDLGRALTVLQEALFQIRRLPAASSPGLGDAEARVLATHVDLALADGTARVMDRAQYELGRAREKSPLVAQLQQLVQGALACLAGGDRSLRLLDAVPTFDSLALELHRQGLRARASRRCAPEIEDATLHDIAAWAADKTDTATRARLSLWMGWWHYRRGRFAEAARLQRRASAGEPSGTGRLVALTACASALLETFDLREASAYAEEALRGARRSGSSYIEARAEWLLRVLAYRSGAVSAPDLPLVEAATQLHSRDLEASIRITEASFAYRGGLREEACALAESAVVLWKFVHDPGPLLLARCLALAAGGAPETRNEIEALGKQAMACLVPGIGIQALGLLTRARRRPRRAWLTAVPALIEAVPRASWGHCLDVLSVRESLDALGWSPAVTTPREVRAPSPDTST